MQTDTDKGYEYFKYLTTARCPEEHQERWAMRTKDKWIRIKLARKKMTKVIPSLYSA
jgi:hypothetical protein